MKKNTSEIFGENLKQIRKQKRMSLRQVSENSKKNGGHPISPTYLSLLERGKREMPKLSVLKRIARGLNISEGEIINIANTSTFISDISNSDLKIKLENINGILTYNNETITNDELFILKSTLKSIRKVKSSHERS